MSHQSERPCSHLFLNARVSFSSNVDIGRDMCIKQTELGIRRPCLVINGGSENMDRVVWTYLRRVMIALKEKEREKENYGKRLKI